MDVPGIAASAAAPIDQCKMQHLGEQRCAADRFHFLFLSFFLSFFFFLFLPPPLASPRTARGSERRRRFGRPAGFTSAESGHVKADACKSYGGRGWKIKRADRTGRSLYAASGGTSGVKAGRTDERKRDAKGDGTDGHARTRRMVRTRGETGRAGGRRVCRGSIISVYSLTSYTFGCQTFVMKRMLGGLYG